MKGPSARALAADEGAQLLLEPRALPVEGADLLGVGLFGGLDRAGALLHLVELELDGVRPLGGGVARRDGALDECVLAAGDAAVVEEQARDEQAAVEDHDARGQHRIQRDR